MKLTHILICAAFFLMLGCGLNDSTSSDPTPPSQNITGTYKLSSASGDYVHQNGVLSFDYATSITGTLVLGQESWKEIFVVDGGTYSKNGTYIVNYTNSTVSGTIGVAYESGGGIYNFSIEGYNLNLTGAPNSNWTKISNQ